MTAPEAGGAFLDACAGRRSPRVPIWLTGQSGAYVPEHRELRARHGPRALATEPELAAEMTAQPIRRYGLDAAPLATDPMLFLEHLGVALTERNGRLAVAAPVRTRGDIEDLPLARGSDEEIAHLEPVARAAVEALGDVPLLAVSPGPYTLASALVEADGRAGRLPALLMNDPSASEQLLSGLTALVAGALRTQIRGGARAVLIQEPVAAWLPSRDFRRHVQPRLLDVFRRLEIHRAPCILDVPFGAHLLDQLVRCGASVLALDHRVPLEIVRTRLPEDVSIQGNLDPTVLLGPVDAIRERALDVLIEGTLYRGHIFNLGGAGVPQETPPDALQTLVEVVRDFDPRLQGWGNARRG